VGETERGDRDRVREEIVDIHRFLSKWISGACTGDEATYRKGLASRLSKNFVLVTPLGKTFTGEAFTRMMRGNHGSDPTLQIDIRNVEVRHREDTIVVVTFEAWQGRPADLQRVNATPQGRGRVCTVVMKHRRDRFEFLHVHETWLPDERSRQTE
jgi:hypothetical protein